MFLTYNEKLENSEVIGEQVIHKLYFYVRSPKKRIKSILSFLLITGISLYLKINSPNPIWETFVIATLVSIVSMILLHLFTYSIYERNHPTFCKNLEFINKTAKLFLFNDAIRLFKLKLETFVEKYDTGRNYLEILFDAVFKLDGDSWEIIIGVFNDAVVPTVSFFVAIIVFIPVFFYFLAFNIDLIKKIIPWLIPIVNVVVYFKWLFNLMKLNVFYDDTYYELGVNAMADGLLHTIGFVVSSTIYLIKNRRIK